MDRRLNYDIGSMLAGVELVGSGYHCFHYFKMALSCFSICHTTSAPLGYRPNPKVLEALKFAYVAVG
jgi:hypothetical protein